MFIVQVFNYMLTLAQRKSHGKTSIASLHLDIFLSIFSHLSTQDILRVRQTCRSLLEITRLRSVWYTQIHTQVLEQNIPIPGLFPRSLDSLTTEELEEYTLRALRMRRNWISPDPVSTEHLEITAMPHSRILSLHFLPGRGHRWLLSLGLVMAEGRREFLFQCWDLNASLPNCVARRQVGNFGGFAVNTDATSPAILAIKCPLIEILTIDFTSTNPTNAFVTLTSFRDDTLGIHLLSGSTILTRQSENRLYLWDINDPDIKCELQGSQHQSEKVMDGILRDRFAILIRATVVEIYGLVPGLTGRAIRELQPIAQHNWLWRIDSIAISNQTSWSAIQSGRPPPINILIRFGSVFPWPINNVHHFVLRPNRFYEPFSDVNAMNLPFHLPPTLLQTVASPVRLFATSQLSMGSYGTPVWVDSHTEDYYKQSSHGQRLAGSFLPTGITRYEDDEEESDQVAPTSAPTVFKHQEVDKWSRVEVDDQEGRIATGSIDGRISIFKYA